MISLVKETLRILLISLLLFLVLYSSICPFEVKGNFYATATTPPPQGTVPPTISIFSPANKSYSLKQIPFKFNVTSATCIQESSFSLPEVYYKGDWMTNESFAGYGYDFNLHLNYLSEGAHNVTVRAEQGCFYQGDAMYYFRIENQTTIEFSIDYTAPTITVSVRNSTYDVHSVYMSFNASEPVSNVTYNLDNFSNVTINGETMLSNLSFGTHNITVSAQDDAGNVGTSEKLIFTIAEQPKPEPFPKVSVAAVFGVSVVVVIVGLVVYLKKLKH